MCSNVLLNGTFLIHYISFFRGGPQVHFRYFKEVNGLLNKFDIQVRESKEHAIIETAGYLNDALGEKLSEKAQELIQNGYTLLVINLEQTTLINSIGISILIEIIEALDEREGTLNFCGLSATQERTFRMMAIAKYAGIFPDEESAIANL
ncbi:STAS domain-containing protein [Candidatus Poribacteria bacterium]|nr:STAS domain-containing protein [Candidatus Poribacteria bacterium]